MKSTLSFLWRWSIVVTIPVSLMFLYWLNQTLDHFWDFGMRYDSSPVSITLRETGVRKAQRLANRIYFEAFGRGGRNSVGPNDPRLISLFVDEGKLAKLNANLPHSGFEEVKGQIWHNGAPMKCDVRYRGDYAPHWAFAKKSWRIKTSTSQLWEGMRKFNLISPKYPEQINNYFGYRLARELDLIGPRTEMVQVAVNGKLRGIHLLVEQIEELTLRANGFMPGDMYSGELVAKDAYIGLTNSVFLQPELWEKVSINNHYAPDAKDPLIKLASLVSSYPSEASHAELIRMLDLEAWARFSVFELVTQCFHFDEAHNWRLFYDANRRRFVPVVWDSIALQPDWRPRKPGHTYPDIIACRLHAMLHHNADFLRARHRALRDFFAKGMDDKFLRIAKDARSQMWNALGNDVNRRPASMDAIRVAFDRLEQGMGYILADLRQTYLSKTGLVRFDLRPDAIRLEVSGRRPITELRVGFHQPLKSVPGVKIRYTMDGRPYDVDVSAACSISGNELSIRSGLIAQLVDQLVWRGLPMLNLRKSSIPAYYEIVLSKGPDPRTVREIRCERGHGLETAQHFPGKIQPRDTEGMFGLVRPQPQEQPLRIRGTIEVKQNTEVHRDVIIAKGTTFVMHPGASIRFWGRVDAAGTKDRPIQFRPRVASQKPWGVVALQGQATKGSRLRHVHFELGTGWKEPTFEYSAMFSVHDSDEVLLHNCVFKNQSRAKVVDDMVHTVYSHVEFHNCVFEDSYFDALDMDICTGKVIRCTFRRSGNDSLDLMTSKIVVNQTEILDSGDKAISVGENTTLLATNLKMRRCVIGIEGKDSSRAFVANSLFDANKLAINAYKKNWRYGDGGHVFVHNCRFINTAGGITADKYSDVFVQNSYLDRAQESTASVTFGRHNDYGQNKEWEHKARKLPRLPMPDIFSSIEELARPHFRAIDFNRRGTE